MKTAGEFAHEVDHVIELFLDRYRGARRDRDGAMGFYIGLARKNGIPPEDIEEMLHIAARRVTEELAKP